MAEGNWSFELGQCVTHKQQAIPSLVVSAIRASNGLEFYGVRSYAWKDEQRDRIMMSNSLRRAIPGSDDCRECMLRDSGLCPGAMLIAAE